MKRRYPRRIATFFALTAIAACLSPAVSSAAILEGSVLNQNTQRFLDRATVQVQGTQFQTLSDKNGRFRISGLPAGTYTVTANYSGLDAVTKTITISEDASGEANFELSSADVYKMGEFVVNSTLEGTAFAINQQRRAESVRSVTSIDAFIDQSTGNPGEFLRNISGIQMDFNQGEPNKIRVRGMDAQLTTVTMDGNEIAAAASSGTDRVVEVDQLSMAAIGSVELFKAPIPSMSANAIGGSVNFVTKSAFEQKGRRAGIQVGVMMDSHDFGRKSPGPGHDEKAERRIYPVGRIEYSNAFLNNRLGIVASIGRDHTNMLGSSVTHNLNVLALPGSSLPAPPTPYTLENVAVRRGAMSFAPNRQLRTRTDYSLNTDFRVSDKVTVFLKSTLTYYLSTNRNHGLTLNPGTTYAAGATVTDYTTTNGTATQSISYNGKHTTSWQFAPGLKYKSGDWKAELLGGFSKSTNHYKFDDGFGALSITTGAGLGWTMRTPLDDDTPTSIVQNSGVSFYDLNNYVPSQGNLSTEGQRTNHAGFVSNTVRNSSEVRFSGRLDVQRDFQAKFPFYVKAGLSYNETIRDKRTPGRRWYWVGDDGIPGTADDTTAAGANLGRFAEPIPVTQQIPNFGLREPTYFNSPKALQYWQANPRVLVENLAFAEEQLYLGKSKVNEQITAAYVMGNATFNKLNVLTGVRIEETDIIAQGSRTLPTSGVNSVLPPGVNANSLEGVRAKYRFLTTRSDYRSDPFPYLHLKYDWTRSLLTRASYTEAIGRPSFGDILPSMTQNDAPANGYEGTISVTRTGLLPQRSKNLDFGIEYYTKSAGVWEASWFSRDVNDYISTTTIAMTPELLREFNLGPEFARYQLSTSQNLGNANWRGYEIGVRQQLRDWKFIPSLLQGFEIWANHTNVYQMEGTFDGGASGSKITHLNGVVNKQYNGGISYRSPRGKYYVHVKTNYQTARPTSNLPVGNASGQRSPMRAKYQFWDLEASYRVNQKLRLMCTGRNLFSERPQFTEIGIVRNTQQYTGIQWMFAAKYDL